MEPEALAEFIERCPARVEGLMTMPPFAEEVVVTVREVEARTRAGDRKPGAARQRTDRRSPEIRRLEDELRRHFQTDVQIAVAGHERGAVSIQFFSSDDLERVVDLILGATRENG